MKFNFTQHEVEAKLYKNLEYGDEIQIAERTDKSPTIVSQMANPHDERESNIYKACKDLSALWDISQRRGKEALRLVNHFVGRHIEGKEGCIETSTRRFMKEFNEFVMSRIEDHPLPDQIKELEDVQEFAEKLLEVKRDLLKKRIRSDVFEAEIINR